MNERNQAKQTQFQFMVVLAGLIGAGGLGGEVERGLTRMMIGVGVRSGMAIVF